MTTRPNRHITCLGPRTRLAPALLLSLAMTGCYPAMSTTAPDPDTQTAHLSSNMTPPPGHGPYTGTVADWPLWFTAHDFGVHCFDTERCEVLYRGLPHGSDEPTPSVASYGRPLEELLSAGRGPILNFPAPAVVNWESKDGSSHHAEIDIGKIFQDKLIRHKVAREDIPEGISIGSTDIILEVNGRTITVYTRTHIPTKELQIPGNKYSDFKNDLIKVFSHTYLARKQ